MPEEQQGKQPEKELYIDEDWKSQVEAEREQLKQKKESEGTEPDPTQADQPDSAIPEMPPASFAMHVTSLASEAMMALGQVPHPMTGKTETNLKVAKYFIDTLAVLEEKTKGNLTAEESQALEAFLHQLRLGYVTSGMEKPDDAEGGMPEA